MWYRIKIKMEIIESVNIKRNFKWLISLWDEVQKPS